MLVLSSITLWVSNGLFQAYANYNYAWDYYSAGINAESLLLEVRVIAQQEEDLQNMQANISTLLDSETFRQNYETDRFDYSVFTEYIEYAEGVTENLASYTMEASDLVVLTVDVKKVNDDKLLKRMINIVRLKGIG